MRWDATLKYRGDAIRSLGDCRIEPVEIPTNKPATHCTFYQVPLSAIGIESGQLLATA
jgi:hypothetical protein